MTRGLSIWLDALRVAATLIVVLSHFAYPRFTGTSYAFLRDWNVGSDAVIVFFVLSGCVIAFAADRDETAGKYTFHRLSRLMTVMVPALVLTLAFDAIGHRIDSSAYPAGFYQSHPMVEYLARGLTMSNEWSLFGRLRLGTNGPLWSLSYEVVYYALFGVAMFLSGAARIAAVLALCVIAGLNILLLMPAWLMGVALWRWIRANKAAKYGRTVGVMLVVAGPAAYLLCQIAGVPDLLAFHTAHALGVADAREVLGFSDEFLWNFLIGVFTTLLVAGIVIVNPQHVPCERPIRWLAGASFSVYVTHYPTLHLLDASLPEVAGRDLFLLFGSIAFGLVFARYFERPIKRFRQLIQALISPTTSGKTV
ncbi:acyltransferase family protein [Ruegeria atlantica]|uniref:Acyltransferase family protein n=1 Tax=Ruegeria atlantica TaxID=81569 RepID=A0A0P1E282_9RHOB|nr:acyltransferase [Ruegeria atlantica]CUH42255.1 Acyltransferase family protein [Ruegeria atlantica]